MSNESLARIWKPVAEAVTPGEIVRMRKRVNQAIADDGQVLPEALTSTASRIPATWFFSGTVTVATNKGLEYRVPMAGHLERLDASVKTAPTGASLIARVKVNGTTAATVTITATNTTDGVAANVALDAGDILTVDVTQVGSTIAGSDLSLSATYRIGVV